MTVKIVRVITNSSVVPWHLDKYLRMISKDKNFDVFVVGTGASEHALSYPEINFIDCNIERKINIFRDFYSVISLFRILKRLQPDIVHSLMPKSSIICAIAALIARVPIRLHTYTGQMWNLKKVPKLNVVFWCDWLVNKLNTKCYTDSPSQSLYLQGLNISENGKPLDYFLNGSLSGVDINAVNLELSKDYNIPCFENYDDYFVLGFMARKTREKGIFDLLNVFYRFRTMNGSKKTVLFFIGPDDSGGELDILRSQSPELFEGVVEIGAVDMPFKYLSNFDVLLLPSYREGFGSIIIDAAVCGVPSISSNIVGLKDAVEHEKTGYLFEVGDIEKATEYLNVLYYDINLRESLARNAYDRAISHFDCNEIYDEQIRSYNNLIKQYLI
ncbi:glycosyltransferase [Vibrio owensii]|uniref:glycosyltransferase n=1 Tax=Vibrio owensii TaxID=696485 RepID=UPI0018F26DFC|nr:glycosyltransferase [Vibrio owensii]